MSENNGKVLRDTDGEIVGFWTKPPESGSISCSNIEGLTCGDPDPYTCTDDEAHPDYALPILRDDMTRDEAARRIKEHMVYHKRREPNAVLITRALEMAIVALEQPSLDENRVAPNRKCSLCRQSDGNGEKRYYCMSHGDFVGGDECCSRFQPEEEDNGDHY